MVGCSEDTTKNLDEKGKQALATTKKEEHDYKKVTELTLSNDYEDEYVEITGTGRGNRGISPHHQNRRGNRQAGFTARYRLSDLLAG